MALMRWAWLVWIVLLGAVAPAGAGTMTTSISNPAFGSAHVGVASATTRTITINNTAAGGGPMAFTVTSDLTEYTAMPASGAIAAGGMQIVTITFTPTSRGLRNATLTVATPDDNSGNPVDTFPVSGTGTSGNLVVAWTASPGALDFASAAVSGGTVTRTITVSNPAPANEPLKFSLAITTGDYNVPSTVDVVLAVDANVQITVTFNPTVAGTRTGTATITADDAFNASDTVSLTGVGGAVFTASPTSIDFGNTVLVGAFAEQTLTITNTGSDPAQVTAIASGNSVFTVTPVGAALPRMLNPAQALEVTVRFTPVTGAIVTSNLSVTTTGTPAAFQVPVSGDGLYKAVTIVATNEADLMIDLGTRRVGVLFAQVITVTNTGETAQTLALPTSDATQCTITPTLPSTLPTLLDPLEAATFEIRVTPSVLGVGSCTITVATDIPTTDDIVVDWQGIAPEVELSTPTTAMINFGVTDVDAPQTIRTVVLDNTGGAPLAIGPCVVTGSARFSVVTNCTNLTVAPNASATLMVAFDPMLEAAETGTLTIGVDALSRMQVVIALSGVGADQRLDLSALSVSFPDTNVSTNDAPIEYIDIHNPVNPVTGIAETLTISAATTDNDVFVLANEGPFTVEGGAMIRIAITFRPQQAGVYDGTLTILSDASGLPMAEIALNGRGIVAGADEGGGCCQSGGRSNGWLALLVFALLRRRRSR